MVCTSEEFARPGFSPKHFLDVAMTLHDLDKSQGKPFGILAEESAMLLEDVAKLKTEVESSRKGRANLVDSVKVLESQLQSAYKIEFLQGSLEERCRAIARQRGLKAAYRDNRTLGASLAAGTAAAILGGLATRDGYYSLNAGLSSFDGTLRKVGNTIWAVSLAGPIIIAPRDSTLPNGKWVTQESLKLALEGLKAEASQGRALGTVDDVVNGLRQSKGKLVYLLFKKPV